MLQLIGPDGLLADVAGGDIDDGRDRLVGCIREGGVQQRQVVAVTIVEGQRIADLRMAGLVKRRQAGRHVYQDPPPPPPACDFSETRFRQAERVGVVLVAKAVHHQYHQATTTEFPVQGISPAVMGDCSINPNSGLGYYPDRLPKPQASRNVLVVGGGVGGMQAAITAARRGHKVTLAEKGERLGGVLLFAEHDHDKHEWMDFEHVLERELAESGATVELNACVDEKYLRAKSPDYVILAVGAHNRTCPLPGAERAMDAADTYFHMDQIGHSVVIAGGGLTACETALNLAAAGHEVTIVARKPRLTPSTFGYYRNALLDEMDRRGIKQLLSTCPLAFTDEGLVCEKATDEKGTPGGERLVVSADTYVYSFGMDPNSDEVERLTRAAEAVGAKVTNVGNSKEAGIVRDAVHGGDQAAMSIL